MKRKRQNKLENYLASEHTLSREVSKVLEIIRLDLLLRS